MSVENLKKKKNDEWVEDTRYHENIPDQVIGEMPLEYDIHIGMIHGIGRLHGDMLSEEKYEITMPRSVILYLNHLDNVPSKETCLIRFADGTTHEYSVPVMKIQNYTIEMIEEKHLNMLIPFLPIRFRKYLNRKKDGVKQPVSEVVRKDLTEFVRHCIMIIDREKRNGTLTDMAGKDIMDLLGITCGYLFKNEPELNKEVQGIMKPIIMLQSERAEIAEKELEEIKPIVKLQSERAEIAERELEEIRPIVKLQSERAEIAEKELEEMRSILKQQSERAEITERELETSIKKFIERTQSSGQNRQNIKEDIQDIFSLNEEEAEKKLKKYWK